MPLYSVPHLGLSNIKARCESLVVKQMCRILQFSSSHKDHLKYWLGLKLRNIIPELGQGANAPFRTPCSNMMLRCCRIVDVYRLPKVSASKLYKESMETPPPLTQGVI